MSTSTDHNRLKLLIVEDEFMIATQVARYFVERGAEVVGFAPTASKAHQIIQGGPPFDAAILDIRLRDVEAFEVADLVRRAGACLIFYTAMDPAKLPERFRNAPVVSKPESMDKLYSRVMRALEEG